MNYLDLFSGIGGFHKGLEEAGFNFEWVGFSEIEKDPIKIYRKHYPKAVNYRIMYIEELVEKEMLQTSEIEEIRKKAISKLKKEEIFEVVTTLAFLSGIATGIREQMKRDELAKKQSA